MANLTNINSNYAIASKRIIGKKDSTNRDALHLKMATALVLKSAKTSLHCRERVVGGGGGASHQSTSLVKLKIKAELDHKFL